MSTSPAVLGPQAPPHRQQVPPRPGVVAEVERVRQLLTPGAGGAAASAPPHQRAPEVARLAALFGLSGFETDLLLLAAAVELDGEVARLCAVRHGGASGDPRPSFGLAFATLPDAHWDALSPERPLRRWHLLEVGAGPTLATRPLAIDEQILHELTGVAAGHDLLAGLVTLLDEGELSPAQRSIAAGLAAATSAIKGHVLVQVSARDADTSRAAATHVAAGLGCRALLVRTDALPPGHDLAAVATLIDRTALLRDAVPVLGGADPLLAELLVARVVICLGDSDQVAGRFTLRRDLPQPDAAEQHGLWQAALGIDDDHLLWDAVGEVAQHFRFGAATVAGIAQEAAATGAAADPAAFGALCRDRARVGLDGLAERVTTRASWDDLVLPDGQTRLLHDIADHVRHRGLVHGTWGFAEKADRGLGVTALFAGESGTGKTMAAEILARDLGLDLYRIDLSAVVSKYIGETEKNLRRVFDTAESSGAVLLFDEADALFGKRGEVRDGHDRYANLEVSYLLQRMETYRGLAILTTNLRSNVDRAFLRRLRFVVQFPFPDEAQRARIWARAFPADTPLDALDPVALARLQIPGGSIRAIALGAAFAAAAAGGPVGPQHVLHAASVEYAKAERSLTDGETTVLRRALSGGSPA